LPHHFENTTSETKNKKINKKPKQNKKAKIKNKNKKNKI
jgi:hypothetical protein